MNLTKAPIRSSLIDDPDLKELVVEFVGKVPLRIQGIQTAIAKKDSADLKTKIHQLRGACGSYGFRELTPLATSIENRLQAGESIEQVQNLLDEYLDACGRITDA